MSFLLDSHSPPPSQLKRLPPRPPHHHQYQHYPLQPIPKPLNVLKWQQQGLVCSFFPPHHVASPQTVTPMCQIVTETAAAASVVPSTLFFYFLLTFCMLNECLYAGLNVNFECLETGLKYCLQLSLEISLEISQVKSNS